jgi:exodeoxyribonuclease-3
MRILSWNVNGIRAVWRKGFLEWLNRELPDILCLQETKGRPEQLNGELQQPQGYYAYWSYATKRGYSGVVTFTKRKQFAEAIRVCKTFVKVADMLIEEGSGRGDLKPKRDKFTSWIEKLEKNHLEAQND